MWTRCNNPNHVAYARYGGRGIKVCARWRQFEHFLADMGERPEGTTLDRINPDGNYEPRNVRWATSKEQIRGSVAYRRNKELCPKGHPYDDENTYIRPDGNRGCKECKRESVRKARQS